MDVFVERGAGDDAEDEARLLEAAFAMVPLDVQPAARAVVARRAARAIAGDERCIGHPTSARTSTGDNASGYPLAQQPSAKAASTAASERSSCNVSFFTLWGLTWSYGPNGPIRGDTERSSPGTVRGRTSRHRLAPHGMMGVSLGRRTWKT